MTSADLRRDLLKKLDENELFYAEGLEETKAQIISLEQQLAGQPGLLKQLLQNTLADARFRRGRWESFLSTLQETRKLFTSKILTLTCSSLASCHLSQRRTSAAGLQQEQLAYDQKMRDLHKAKREQSSRLLYPATEGVSPFCW